MSHDIFMTRANGTSQADASIAESRVARCVFVNKSDLGKGEAVPPLHPCGYLRARAFFLLRVRLFATPQTYLEV